MSVTTAGAPWEMLHFVCSTAYFPLTLTLSLRERESRFRIGTDWCLADGCWANSGTVVIKRRWTLLPLPRGEYVFSVPAAPVAQTCSLLYRRFLTCHRPPASNLLPITNRRYGRLKICATLNGYKGDGRCEREPSVAHPTVQSLWPT